MKPSLLALLCSILPCLAAAQIVDEPGRIEDRAIDPEAVSRPESFAARVASPIDINGRLDESAWESASRSTHSSTVGTDSLHPRTSRRGE